MQMNNAQKIINRIKDEREHRNKTTKAYLDEEEIILFGGSDAKVRMLRRMLEYDSDYKNLRPGKMTLEVLDGIMKLIQKYTDIQVMDEKAFKELYEFSLTITDNEESKDDEYKRLIAKLEDTEAKLAQREKKIQEMADEHRNTLYMRDLAEVDPRSFLEKKAREDPAVKKLVEQMQNDGSYWSNLTYLGKDKSIKPQGLTKEMLTAQFDSQLWSEMRQYYWLHKQPSVRTKMGQNSHPSSQVACTRILSIPILRWQLIRKTIDAHKTDKEFMAYLEDFDINMHPNLKAATDQWVTETIDGY